jgi:hypothetical protein
MPIDSTDSKIIDSNNTCIYDKTLKCCFIFRLTFIKKASILLKNKDYLFDENTFFTIPGV